jgi:hypothetical protein
MVGTMSIWDDTIFEVGDRVLTDIGKTGKIIRIRFDSRGDRLITVYLDDPTATPDGLYLARDFELRRA